MRLLFCASLILFGVALQGTVLYRALPGGITLDLALLLTLLAAWRRGPIQALFIGLWGGALVGTAMGSLLPLMAVLYATVGWTAGLLLGRPAARPSLLKAFCLGAAMVVSLSGLQGLILALAGQHESLEPTSVGWSMLWHGLALAFMVGLADFRWRSLFRRKGSEGSKQWTADSASLAGYG